MRLNKIQDFLRDHSLDFQYSEDDDCGSIEFDYRGLAYHVWEFPAPQRGAESNVRTAGRNEEFEDDYEDSIISIMESWEGIK